MDTSEVLNNPEATIQKARTIQRAALAPANPSGQDRQVAAQTAQMEREAQRELSGKQAKETKGYDQNGKVITAAQNLTPIDLVA